MARDLGFPAVSADAIPWLTVAEMREGDRVMIYELGITLVRMMENAGRGLAALARRLLGGSASVKSVAVLAGRGGNGGGSLVAARHLAVAGANVEVLLAAEPAELTGVPAEQLTILDRLEVSVRVCEEVDLAANDLVIDALLGYSAAGAPRGEVARLIRAAEGARVLALDAPSGLELETGELHEPYVTAAATLTLAAPKEGLRASHAARAVGDLYLADISVPSLVYERLGHPPGTPFAAGPIVRIVD